MLLTFPALSHNKRVRLVFNFLIVICVYVWKSLTAYYQFRLMWQDFSVHGINTYKICKIPKAIFSLLLFSINFQVTIDFPTF